MAEGPRSVPTANDTSTGALNVQTPVEELRKPVPITDPMDTGTHDPFMLAMTEGESAEARAIPEADTGIARAHNTMSIAESLTHFVVLTSDQAFDPHQHLAVDSRVISELTEARDPLG